MTQAERRRRTAEADELCSAALTKALDGADDTGVALVAVGGYGRLELAPHSDLDVVLVHADEVDVHRVAQEVWYPLWDAGANIDHSVRAMSEVADTARDDPRVALGLLDARHLAGDPSLTLRLRADLLAHWRRDARRQLPALKDLVDRRGERTGELAHASVPDLKESVGGLRDATVLRALVATWLVDVSHADLEPSRLALLDVRDVLHEVAGRATDRVAPETWPELAAGLGLPDDGSAQRQVREVGRRITHLSRLTWQRVEAVLARPLGHPPPGARARAGGSRDRGVPGGGRPGPGDRPGRRPAPAAARRGRGRRATAGAVPGHRLAARPRGRRPPRAVEPRGPQPVHPAARRRTGAAARLGDPRRDRGPGPAAARVGARAAAPARLGGAPVHRRPAPGRDLHRDVPADPAGVASRRADGRGPAARPRQGTAASTTPSRASPWPRTPRPAWASTSGRWHWSVGWCAGTCCWPRCPPRATWRTRRRWRTSWSGCPTPRRSTSSRCSPRRTHGPRPPRRGRPGGPGSWPTWPGACAGRSPKAWIRRRPTTRRRTSRSPTPSARTRAGSTYAWTRGRTAPR